MNRFFYSKSENIIAPTAYLSNTALGGRVVIAYSNMGGTHEQPSVSNIFEKPHQALAISIGGDLCNIETIREFWQLTISILEEKPNAVWLNLTSVNKADTKLAACIVAILRRADVLGVNIHIIGSLSVDEIMTLCKLPVFTQFTVAKNAA